jgi:cell division protein FtsQ
LPWEDDLPAQPRYRRAQQVTPQTGRSLPGMPVAMPDPDEDDEFPRMGRPRFDAPRVPWWRPASKWGRIFLACGVLLALAATTTAVYAFKTFLERDSRFRITGTGSIEAAGLTEVTRADILPVFGEDIGRNIFFVPLSQRRKELEKIPWVERATVMRLLPDQLRVDVVERKPVAFVRQGQQIGLVDADGVQLSMPAAAMSKHHYSFPVVTGIDAGDTLAARHTRMAVYSRLIKDLDSSGQHLSEQISEIDLTDPEDARVVMPEQGADILAHFGDDQFLARYQRYKAHIAEWRQQYPRLAAVDLRYDQQVVLKMASGSSTGSATDDSNSGKHLTEPADDLVKPSPAVKAVAAKAAPEKAAKARPAAHKAAGKAAKAHGAKDKKHVPAKHAPAKARHPQAASSSQTLNRQGQ